jgi:nitrate/nitrite transporter NarK
MDNARRTTLGAALFVLICFFLPWVQVSCLGMKDSESGFDLARSDDRLLWLVPILMIAVISLYLAHTMMNRAPWLFSLVGISSGLISAWLIYRARASDGSSALLPTFWTVWYWLGLVASLIVSAGALRFYTRRARAP